MSAFRSDAGRELAEIVASNRTRALGSRGAPVAPSGWRTSSALGRHLRGLARASLAVGALLTASCASSHAGTDAGTRQPDAQLPMADAGPADAASPVADAGRADAAAPSPDAGARPDAGMVGPFQEPLCDEGRWQAAHGLSLTRSPDYLDVFDGGWFGPMIQDSIGTRCATAGDAAACEAELAATGEMAGRVLRTTDGDDVDRLAEDVDVLSLLGAIDTPNEALLRAWLAGYDVRCGDAQRWGVREVDGGYEVTATRMVQDCDPIIVMRYVLRVGADGSLVERSAEEIERQEGVCVGRRPAGLGPRAQVRAQAHAEVDEDRVAAHFAEVARLEAGAVHAFEALAAELAHHGAPADLVEEARRAARDEVRHADAIGAIAHRLGAPPEAPVVPPAEPRPLLEIALDNAREGCVRETFGALIGHHQALAAADASVRAAMEEIAADETRHASLSWKMADWLDGRLTAPERDAVRRERAKAVLELRAEMAIEPAAALVRWAGLPRARAAVELVDAMAATVWAPGPAESRLRRTEGVDSPRSRGATAEDTGGSGRREQRHERGCSGVQVQELLRSGS